MRVVRTCDFCGDDATGLYEPLPSSIPDGPRLLLCDPCRDRLAAVVDPLVERLEGGDVDGGATDAPAPPRASGAGADPSSREREDASSEVPERPERGGQGPPERPHEDPEEDQASSTAAPERDAGPSVSESRDASGRSQPDRAGTPHGYRKVMRFLENRELPMQRESAVGLAAEAYDLDDADVERSIDHAVQYGRLREVEGELKR